jgi:hypothetical protein
MVTGNLVNTMSKCLKFYKGESNTLYQAPQTFSLPLEQLLQHYYSCQGLNRNVSAIFYKTIIKHDAPKNEPHLYLD